MALNIPAGFGQAVWRWLVSGDPEEMVVTCGIDNVGTNTGQDVANDLADDFEAAFTPAMVNGSYTFKGVRLYVSDGSGGLAVFEANRTVAGTDAAPALPNNCAILVRKRSGLAGRRHQGRLYVPPFLMTEGNIDQVGNMSAGNVTTLQGRVNSWLAGATFPKVILHDVNAANPVPLAPTPITSFVVDGKIATQRRRLRR